MAARGLSTVAHAAGYYSVRPLELVDRLRSEYERRSEPAQTRVEPLGGGVVQAIHALLGVNEPCVLCADMPAVWAAICARFPGQHHHDAGLGTVEGVWVATRHLRPKVVVETGVARGFSSAAILAALEANGTGHLWSVDLPQVDLLRSGQAQAAVAEEHRRRWTYVTGGSRRVLPRVVAGVDQIDLFVHDSLHTASNIRFELDLAWPRLRAGGLILVDDAGDNGAFVDFATREGLPYLLLARRCGNGALGVLRKPG